MKRVLRINEPREYSREEERPNNKSDGAKTLYRPLQFALLAFAHAVRHHALRCREGNIPHRNYRNRRDVNSTRSGETGNDQPDRPEKLSDVKCATLTKTSNDSPSESAGNCCCEDADDRERNANPGLAPLITINRVERPDHEYFVRDIGKKLKRS